MINTLKEIENYIEEFNQNNGIELYIDTIRIEFSKQHKLNKLKELGTWNKIKANNNILFKLKNRLAVDEVTTAYQLDAHNVYFYNKKDETKKYRKAEMVIFAMKQYHKAPPPYLLIENIVNMLTYKNSKINMNIDVCFDTAIIPKIDQLKKFFELKHYIHKNGVNTETYYINTTNIAALEKIVIYNKSIKNNLKGILYRIEAMISILLTPIHSDTQPETFVHF